jgi:hypothetical protein
MECSICLRIWNSKSCVPLSLPCGHSYCAPCLETLYAKQKTQLVCPGCQTPHKVASVTELRSLPRNFSLLALIRDKETAIAAGAPMPAFAPESGSKRSPTKPKSADPPTANANISTEDDQMDTLISVQSQCERHRLPLHSYTRGSKKPLCDQCIGELPKSLRQLRPIPKVCRYIL